MTAPIRTVVRGVGSYLPKHVMLNSALPRELQTSDEWITKRTGIRQRHVAADGELTSDLATAAARCALQRAGIDVADVDLIIVATATPDETFPATATVVQAKLGMTSGAAFDVGAVCSGFVYALSVADSMLKNGLGTTALVIGAETMTRLLDWTDRTTCVLFGDGAGAMVLQAEATTDAARPRGVLASTLHSDGRLHDLLFVDGGPSSTKTTGRLRMVGREVYKHAVTKLSDVVSEILEAADLTAADIDWVVPHQANVRIIDSVSAKLGIDPKHVIVTVDRHANTSAASIPLALAAADADGRLRPGDLILIEALGGGMTWGANLVRW
jgi:3-oxoacyl-[acyl-carrier-protein] synthase-3